VLGTAHAREDRQQQQCPVHGEVAVGGVGKREEGDAALRHAAQHVGLREQAGRRTFGGGGGGGSGVRRRRRRR
jgi:hypothetical protein